MRPGPGTLRKLLWDNQVFGELLRGNNICIVWRVLLEAFLKGDLLTTQLGVLTALSVSLSRSTSKMWAVPQTQRLHVGCRRLLKGRAK